MDFRRCVFSAGHVRTSAHRIGDTLYWRLYFSENVTRVIVHSVLTAQLGPAWWATAVSTNTTSSIQSMLNSYAANQRHAIPGTHAIYFLFLPQLSLIVRSHINLFLQVIPTAQDWSVSLDRVKVPRNLVGHMNWPNAYDRRMIENVYSQTLDALASTQTSAVAVSIP